MSFVKCLPWAWHVPKFFPCLNRLSLFYRERNGNSERLSHVSQIAQLIMQRAQMKTRAPDPGAGGAIRAVLPTSSVTVRDGGASTGQRPMAFPIGGAFVPESALCVGGGQTSAGGSAEAGNLAVSVQWRSLFPPSPENPQRPQWGDEGLRGQSLSNAELWATAVQAAGPVPSVQAKAA